MSVKKTSAKDEAFKKALKERISGMLKESVDQEVDKVVDAILGRDEDALCSPESADEHDSAYAATGSAGINFNVSYDFKPEVIKFIRHMLG